MRVLSEIPFQLTVEGLMRDTRVRPGTEDAAVLAEMRVIVTRIHPQTRQGLSPPAQHRPWGLPESPWWSAQAGRGVGFPCLA